MRIEQEIILGIGGARALREMGIKPTIWHINEGHAAFMMLERMRDLVQQGLDLAERAGSGSGKHHIHHAYRGAGGA